MNAHSILHENWTQTKRLKELLPLLVPGVAVILLFIFLVVPKARDLNRIERRVSHLRQSLERSLSSKAVLSKGVFQKLLKHEEKIDSSIPDSELFLTYLEEVKEVGESLGIPMIAYDKGAPEDLSTEEILAHSKFGTLLEIEEMEPFPLKGLPVRFQFHCTYRELYTFLRKLRKIDRYTDIQGLSLKKLPDSLGVELKTKIFFLNRKERMADDA